MNDKHIAESSSAEYVDLDMQLRDVRCLLLSVSVNCDTQIVTTKQCLSRGRVEMTVIEIDNVLNFYR